MSVSCWCFSNCQTFDFFGGNFFHLCCTMSTYQEPPCTYSTVQTLEGSRKKVIYCIQVISICWIQGLMFRRLHSCQSGAAFLERNILENWVFSLKLVLWEMGQLWIHPSPWLQHWVRMNEKKQRKGNAQTLTGRSRGVQNAKWTEAREKAIFWRIWHVPSLWEKAITVFEWEEESEGGREEKREPERESLTKSPGTTIVLPIFGKAGDPLMWKESLMIQTDLIWLIWLEKKGCI